MINMSIKNERKLSLNQKIEFQKERIFSKEGC